jgi:hypothetical protein
LSLADCSATTTLSVILPDAPEPTAAASGEDTTLTTSAEAATYTTITESSVEAPFYPTTYAPSNATGTYNITATYSQPAQYTGGAGKVLDAGLSYVGLGGLGLLLTLF